MDKPQVLVFIDWYAPGFKAGGPVRSMVNMVDHLRDRIDFHIVTSDTDHMATAPYPGVNADRWTTLPGGEQVWYASRAGIGHARWKALINERPWDAVYVNGMYSRWFSIEPLRVLRGTRQRIIVAVRGMLAPGVMKHGALKKRLFLAAMKAMGSYRGVEFQATNEAEVGDVQRWIGDRSIVHLVPNLPRRSIDLTVARVQKSPGSLRLVSMARIAVEKNTLFAIERLKGVRGKVEFHLVGAISDRSYWQKCRQAIAELPDEVTVEHRGEVEPEAVPGMLRGYHALYMPSKGENFGHSMIEALATGVPLLISDRTPWRKLEVAHAGWDIPLEEPGRFTEVVQRLVNMTEGDLGPWRAGAEAMGRRYLTDPVNIEKCFNLFHRP